MKYLQIIIFKLKYCAKLPVAFFIMILIAGTYIIFDTSCIEIKDEKYLDSRLYNLYHDGIRADCGADYPAGMKRFEKELVDIIERRKLDIAQMPLLSKTISINTSPDDLLTIYSFDDFTGGTMRFYQSYCQLRDRNGIKLINLGDSIESFSFGSSFYYDIDTVTLNKERYYLLFSYYQSSSLYFMNFLEVVSFKDGEIKYHKEFFPEYI